VGSPTPPLSPILSPGQIETLAAVGADLIVFCRDRIGYKAPDEIVFLDEMPLNPTGKIDRVGLKRMAEDHLHPHGLDKEPG
jgi:acyl-coenzyme A synthetase/AMP-(fatty) acid ligase